MVNPSGFGNIELSIHTISHEPQCPWFVLRVAHCPSSKFGPQVEKDLISVPHQKPLFLWYIINIPPGISGIDSRWNTEAVGIPQTSLFVWNTDAHPWLRFSGRVLDSFWCPSALKDSMRMTSFLYRMNRHSEPEIDHDWWLVIHGLDRWHRPVSDSNFIYIALLGEIGIRFVTVIQGFPSLNVATLGCRDLAFG